MAEYVTEQELRNRAGGLTASAARESLRRSTASAVGPFDIFLSHSYSDAAVILGLYRLLTDQNLSVYVDWISDPELDRARVTAATAGRLRDQMRRSSVLMYATSRSARRSRWMPWELGYFDGIRGNNRVSIIPIDDGTDRAFEGQEYLSLYRVITKERIAGTARLLVTHPGRLPDESLRSFVGS